MYFHLICDHLKFKNTVGLLNKSYYSYVIFSICKSLKKHWFLNFLASGNEQCMGFWQDTNPGNFDRTVGLAWSCFWQDTNPWNFDRTVGLAWSCFRQDTKPWNYNDRTVGLPWSCFCIEQHLMISNRHCQYENQLTEN